MRDNESDPATATPIEGVRILGAKETPVVRDDDRDDRGDRDAFDLPAVAPEEPDTPASFAHRAAVPVVPSVEDDDAEPQEPPPLRDPAMDQPIDQPLEVPPLPHWTEPPTGAVPAIFADDTGEQPIADDLDAWAPIGGASPRFRAEGSDWAEADFGDDLSGENERLGALSEDAYRMTPEQVAGAISQCDSA